jgi:hypothetical protein
LQLRCECCLFTEFPAIEWVVKLRNGGKEETPMLDGIQALDATFSRKPSGDLVLHRALGSAATRNDFAPVVEVMRPDAPRPEGTCPAPETHGKETGSRQPNSCSGGAP